MATGERIYDLTFALTQLLRGEVPQMTPKYYAIERRGTRFRPVERLPVQVQFWDAHLVDISLSGVLVEHTERVRPGEVYHLTFLAGTRKVQVLALAIRSFVSRLVHRAEGEGRILYRTGMEFVGGVNGVADLASRSIEWIPQLPGGG